MATYPTYAQLSDSTWDPDDGLIVRSTESGGTHVWLGYDQTQYRGTIRHFLTKSEAQTLNAFYQQNKQLEVDFTYQGDFLDSQIYSMKLLNRPNFDPHPSGNFFVTVHMVGQKKL